MGAPGTNNLPNLFLSFPEKVVQKMQGITRINSPEMFSFGWVDFWVGSRQ